MELRAGEAEGSLGIAFGARGSLPVAAVREVIQKKYHRKIEKTASTVDYFDEAGGWCRKGVQDLWICWWWGRWGSDRLRIYGCVINVAHLPAASQPIDPSITGPSIGLQRVEGTCFIGLKLTFTPMDLANDFKGGVRQKRNPFSTKPSIERTRNTK